MVKFSGMLFFLSDSDSLLKSYQFRESISTYILKKRDIYGHFSDFLPSENPIFSHHIFPSILFGNGFPLTM